MSRTAERVRDLVLETGEWHGRRDELTGEVPLLGNVIDSLALVSLLSLLESEFDVTVLDAELDPSNFASIDAIVAFIERKRSAVQ